MSVTREWLMKRPSPESHPQEYVLLRFKIQQNLETGLYEGECLDLDVASFGETVEEALEATMEATTLYLETIDEAGEREGIFRQRGIKTYTTEPGDDASLPVTGHPSEIVSVQRFALVSSS